ncbi:MAG: protoporphyrinogen oxidase [Mariniblastus sp.]
MTNSTEKKIVIVGGGISGLAAAFRLKNLAIQSGNANSKVLLLESSQKLGGVLQTEHLDGYVVEQSADMFTTDPSAAIELCRQLGKEDQLLQTIPTPDRAYVATEDNYHPVPRGFSLMAPGNMQAILESPLLSDEDKQRFLEEENTPAADNHADSNGVDESLESFAVRRFGRAMFEKLIQPLASGIYTADPKKLSMNATMQRFIDMEREHGSLIKAAAHARSNARSKMDEQASGARYGLFRAPQSGIGQIVDWIVEDLNQHKNIVEIRTGCPVNSISKSENQWEFNIGSSETITSDGVVVATPAKPAAQLVSTFDKRMADQLSQIKAASSAIVILGVDASQLGKNFEGYGIITPTILGRKTIALSFASNKFPGRAPAGKILIRCFIGGAMQSELVDLNDQSLIKIATDELNQTVGFRGRPEMTKVVRWRHCMPQYQLGHLDRVTKIDELAQQHAGFEIAGNSYRGVGIPACIQSGIDAANRVSS